jgi:hypothetical protein
MTARNESLLDDQLTSFVASHYGWNFLVILEREGT